MRNSAESRIRRSRHHRSSLSLEKLKRLATTSIICSWFKEIKRRMKISRGSKVSSKKSYSASKSHCTAAHTPWPTISLSIIWLNKVPWSRSFATRSSAKKCTLQYSRHSRPCSAGMGCLGTNLTMITCLRKQNCCRRWTKMPFALRTSNLSSLTQMTLIKSSLITLISCRRDLRGWTRAIALRLRETRVQGSFWSRKLLINVRRFSLRRKVLNGLKSWRVRHQLKTKFMVVTSKLSDPRRPGGASQALLCKNRSSSNGQCHRQVVLMLARKLEVFQL